MDPHQMPTLEADENSATSTAAHGNWFKENPYLAAAGGLLLLALIGIFFVMSRSALSTNDGHTTWADGGGLGLFNGLSSGGVPRTPENTGVPNSASTSSQPIFFIPPVSLPEGGEGGSIDEIADLLDELSRASDSSGARAGGQADIGDIFAAAYSFIPQGLIATASPMRARTGTEQALYEYGNLMGAYISGFDDTHANTPQLLKDHIEDRTNPAKIAALRQLGVDLEGLGLELETLDNVPTQAAGMHQTLARAYQSMGKRLQAVADASADDARLYDAIVSFNGSAEAFAKSYIMLATYFETAGVTFSSSDPGSVFTFSQASF